MRNKGRRLQPTSVVMFLLGLVGFIRVKNSSRLELFTPKQHEFWNASFPIISSVSTSYQSMAVVSHVSSNELGIFFPPQMDTTIEEDLLEQLSWRSYEDFLTRKNCAPTGQVELLMPLSPDMSWELQSFDLQGRRKIIGGDEFYITFHDLRSIPGGTWQDWPTISSVDDDGNRVHPTAVAHVEDLNNGRYRLHFVQSPYVHPLRYRQGQEDASFSGSGILTIRSQYICGIGRLGPPAKANWIAGGHHVWSSSQTVDAMPPLAPFVAPHPMGVSQINLRTYRKVLGLGDSLMKQFLGALGGGVPIPNMGCPLNTTTLDQWKEMLDKPIFERELKRENAALIIGSAVWDLLEVQASSMADDDWEDHKIAFEALIGYARERFPEADLFWKSPTALHIHVPIDAIQKGDSKVVQKTIGKRKKLHDRLKYMSASRSKKLFENQKEWCRDLNISLLDLYETSFLAAEETLTGDGRHYTDDFNEATMDWFRKEDSIEELWNMFGSKYNPTPPVQQLPARNEAMEDATRCYIVWIEHINAVLLSMTEQERPSLPTGTLAESCGVPQVHQNNNKSSRQSTRKLWTFEGLVDEGYLESKPHRQLMSELFEKGAEYVYGMILWKTLQWPNVTTHPQMHDMIKVVGREQGRVIAAVMGKGAFGSDYFLQEGLHRLLENDGISPALKDRKRRPQLLIVSDSSKHIKDYIPSSASASLSFDVTSLGGNDDHPLGFLYSVATMPDLDGIILPNCTSDSSRMIRGLLTYIRKKDAISLGHFGSNIRSLCLDRS